MARKTKPLTYGQMLKKLRQDAEFTQLEFAVKCGVNYQTLCNHEQDETRITADHLFAYATGLGKDCSVFKECYFPFKDKRIDGARKRMEKKKS